MTRFPRYPVPVLFLVMAASLGAQRPGSVHGAVVDSIRGGALVGAQVTATALDSGGAPPAAARVDSSGRYRLAAIPPGLYRIDVRHPWLDSTELAVPSDTVRVGPGSDLRVDLGVPSPATIYTQSCHAAPDSSHGLAVGFVRGAESGAPVQGAKVSFLWVDFDVDLHAKSVKSYERGGFVLTDSGGAYRACGLPIGTRIFMQARVDSGGASGVVEVGIDSTALLLRPLRVALARPADTVGAYAVTGTVRDDDGHPVPNSRVHLVGGDRSATGGPDGRFRLTGLYAGTMAFRVQAIGFAPTQVTTDVGPSSPAVSVTLAPLPVMLDSVRSFAQRLWVPPRLRDFDARTHQRIDGVMFTAGRIDSLIPFELTDIIKRVWAFKVTGRGLDARITLRVGRVASGSPMGFGCPEIYIDGIGQTTQYGLNLIATSDLYGVEIYRPGDRGPPGYPNQCGEILIWTK